MKTPLFVVALFSVCVIAAIGWTNRGHAQPNLGPGEKGATLRLPGSEAPLPAEPMPAKQPTVPSYQQNPFASSPFTPGLPQTGGVRIAELPKNDVSVNKDIEISAQQGPWVIYVMSYSGEDALKLAREFVAELRSNMKLNTFVYNSGAKEKEAEFKRVQKIKQDQLEALQKAGLNGSFVAPPVRVVRIDEQTAVLIDGGFKTRDEALNALKRLREKKLKDFPEGFTDRVKLDVKVAIQESSDKISKSGVRVGGAEIVLLNPFDRAFPARNPVVEHDKTPEMDPVDVKLLRELNREEVFTVLKTKKPFTLVIKQFNTQQIVARNKKEAEGFLERFRKGLTLKNGEWSDHAAQSAHDLADAFRKSGLAETYVLHAKYCSYVTVGSYDSVQDNRLTVMQNFLESQLKGRVSPA